MSMGSGADRVTAELLQIIRDVVQDVAPEELPVLAALEQLPPRGIDGALARADRREDPLGFGIGEIAVVATPILWVALQQVVDRMATTAADGTAAWIRTWLRRWFSRRRRYSRAIPHFGPAERDEVRDLVMEQARRMGMKPERAELLALRVADRLKRDGSEG